MKLPRFARRLLLWALDVVCVMASYYVALTMRFGQIGLSGAESRVGDYIVLTLLLLVTFLNFAVHRNRGFMKRTGSQEFGVVLSYNVWLLMGIAVLVMALHVQPSPSRLMLLYFAIVNVIIMSVMRAIAKAAARRGAEVALVSGPTALKKPAYVETVDIVSAEDMYEAVTSRSKDMDIIIKAAAVADYRPANLADNKIKKKAGDMAIPLARTKDILAALGEAKRPGQFLCGFSMETENMVANSRKKLEKKHLDMIAANNVKVAGAGFGVDTNILTLITPDGMAELPLMSKDAAADALLDAILERMS